MPGNLLYKAYTKRGNRDQDEIIIQTALNVLPVTYIIRNIEHYSITA